MLSWVRGTIKIASLVLYLLTCSAQTAVKKYTLEKDVAGFLKKEVGASLEIATLVTIPSTNTTCIAGQDVRFELARSCWRKVR